MAGTYWLDPDGDRIWDDGAPDAKPLSQESVVEILNDLDKRLSDCLVMARKMKSFVDALADFHEAEDRMLRDGSRSIN